jgi:hypothetical protein
VLAPKLTTQISKIAYPAGPRRTLNASAVNLTPSTPDPMSNQTPEIIINNESKEIVIFFHGMVSGNIQKCKIAISKDGLNFNAKSKILTGPYLKLVEYKNSYLGISMSGVFYKFSKNLKNMKLEKGLFLKPRLDTLAYLYKYIFYI